MTLMILAIWSLEERISSMEAIISPRVALLSVTR